MQDVHLVCLSTLSGCFLVTFRRFIATKNEVDYPNEVSLLLCHDASPRHAERHVPTHATRRAFDHSRECHTLLLSKSDGDSVQPKSFQLEKGKRNARTSGQKVLAIAKEGKVRSLLGLAGHHQHAEQGIAADQVGRCLLQCLGHRWFSTLTDSFLWLPPFGVPPKVGCGVWLPRSSCSRASPNAGDASFQERGLLQPSATTSEKWACLKIGKQTNIYIYKAPQETGHPQKSRDS